MKWPKNHCNKRFASKLFLFIEKNWKIRMIFFIENSLWMSNFDIFWCGLALRICKKKLKCFVLWLSVLHGTSNFLYPKMILPNRSHVSINSCIFLLQIVIFSFIIVVLVDYDLTRLTWLIHTSVLPSNWNLGKIFVLTVW